MKRFLVFRYDRCYPTGGWHDTEGSFDALSDAVTAASAPLEGSIEETPRQWWHVVDTQTDQIVAGNDR